MSEDAYRLARRRILNNAKRRGQLTLDLSNKGLTKLPPEIGQLPELTELVLSNNKLTTLPPEIGQLNSLKTLDRAGPACLNRLSASISGASAGIRPPRGAAEG